MELCNLNSYYIYKNRICRYRLYYENFKVSFVPLFIYLFISRSGNHARNKLIKVEE